jgi:hypothetical protein
MNLSIRKYVAAFSVTALIASFLVVTGVANAQSVADYGDLDGTEWYAEEVQWGLDNGILDPTQPDYRPADNMSRAEFTKVALLGSGMTVTAEDECDETLFPDVTADHWGCPYITAAANAGIVSGMGAGHPEEGNFLPNANVLRAEAAKIVVEAWGLEGDGSLGSDWFTDVPVGEWYDTYMGIARYNCVFQGVDNGNTVEPARNINRAEGITVAYRATNPTTECGAPVTAGDLVVALDGASPEGTAVPRNADVTMGIFSLEVAGSDAEVDDMTFYLEGLNDDDDVNRVRIEQNGFTVADRSVNSSDGTVAFSSLNLGVDEGMRTTFELVADLDADVNSQIRFCLNAPEDVTAYVPGTTEPVSVGGSFPLCTGTFETTSSTVGTLDYEVNWPGGTEVEVGKAYEIVTVDLDAGTREDILLNSFTFENQGNADPSAFSDWEIMVGTELPEFDVTWNGDFVTFNFVDPYLIEDGQGKNFDFWATITGGIGDDVLFDIEEDWDIKAIGVDSGYGVEVIEAATNPTNSREIVGGDLSVAFTGEPIVGDISTGDERRLALFNFVTAGAGVTVDGMDLDVCYDGASASYEELNDVKFATYDEDTETYDILAGPESPADPTGGPTIPGCVTLSYNDTFDLPADATTEVYVVADIQDTAPDGAIYYAELDTATIEAEFTSDGTNLQAGDIAGGILTGNDQTVNDPEVTVTTAANPFNRNVVAGTKDLEIVNWNVKASTAEDLTLTQLTVTCNYTNNAGDTDDCRNVFTNLELHLESGTAAAPTLLDGGETFSAGPTGTTTFTNLDDGDGMVGLTIPAGQTVKLALYSDTSKSGDGTDVGSFTIANASDIDIEDSQGDALDAAQKNITGVSSRTITLIDSGILNSSNIKDTDVKARVLVGDTDGNSVVKTRFTASIEESWIINDLSVVGHDPASLAVQHYNAEDEAAWASDVSNDDLNTINGTAISETLEPAQGQEAVGMQGTLANGNYLSYDKTTDDEAFTYAVVNYYVHDEGDDSSYKLDFCTDDTNATLTGGADNDCYVLNGGNDVVEGQWVNEYIDLSTGGTTDVDQFFGVTVAAASGATALDAVIVDSIEFHTLDTAQESAVNELVVSYTDENGDPQSQTAAFTNGTADFNDLGAWVPADGDMIMTIAANTGSVSTLGAAPGDDVKVVLSNLSFEAQGAASSSVRTGTVPAVSNDFIVANNAPVLETVDTLSGDVEQGEIYGFTMTPVDDTRPLYLKQFAVSLDVTDTTLENFELWKDGVKYPDHANQVIITDEDGNDVTSAGGNTITADDTVYVIIDNGGDSYDDVATGATYMLKATTTDTGSSKVVSELAYDTAGASGQITYSTPGPGSEGAEVGTDESSFIWSGSAYTTNGTLGSSSADWLNGYLVEGLESISSHDIDDQ